MEPIIYSFCVRACVRASMCVNIIDVNMLNDNLQLSQKGGLRINETLLDSR